MSLFSSNEDNAIKEIERINSMMKEIRELIRKTGDRFTEINANSGILILNSCAEHYKKYEGIKSKMDFMQRTLFYGITIECWNGEKVGIIQWEQYFKSTFSCLITAVKTLS